MNKRINLTWKLTNSILSLIADQAYDIPDPNLKTNKLSVDKKYKSSKPKLVGAKTACVPKVKVMSDPLI